jgi:AcrR family transcriptional regulator
MTTTSPHRPRKDQLRNRAALLAAAREVFAEYGIDGPLDTIAKRAGLGNATLYRHFPQRVDLIVAVLIVNLQLCEAALAEAAARSSAWDGLSGFLEWVFAEQIDNPAYLSALRAVPAGQNSEVDRLRDKTLGDLQDLIARAKAEGSVRADRWIEDVYLFLALNEQLAGSGHRDPASASLRFLELCLAALASSPSLAPRHPSEPETVLALRRTFGHELAGLPYQDNES